MRPFHAVFIGKVPPSVRPRERGGGGGKEEGGGGERKRKEKLAKCTPVLARANRSHGCAPLLLFTAIHSPHACARRYLSLSLNILRFIYGCPSRFIVVRAALFALTCFNVVRSFLSSCSPLHRLMLFPSLLYFPPSSSSSFAPSSTLPPPSPPPPVTSYFYGTTLNARK